MELTLTPMTAPELARLLGPLEQGYADDLVAHRGMSPEAARERSVDQIRESLPAGAATGSRQAWIHNIDVHPEHQGHGYARRMIQLIEVELAHLGVPELGLNVFGTNTAAIGLYRSLGFEVTSQQMAKRIDRAG
ncbi:GNAT family N-acetyltransferase [Micromonospora taraxaci]